MGVSPTEYIYDSSTNLYYKYYVQRGGTCPKYETFTLTKAVKKGSTIILTESVQPSSAGLQNSENLPDLQQDTLYYTLEYTFNYESATGNYIFSSVEKK